MTSQNTEYVCDKGLDGRKLSSGVCKQQRRRPDYDQTMRSLVSAFAICLMKIIISRRHATSKNSIF